ncbi:GlsB/YeaQ/YmgE family stress response membrane protein [Pseudomarimonas arenosa]|uniref:GlsB/YeaQ/YmgE family stress response membrane protein n=1 Tax=Pseudomarimonas arenosa TaxID=2774145 RepID=A0AAW3ZUH1_9GAMM|nr:GlsB/YeaQ/YmgE family stress response membrane protein [Pseudomarimonas arenosa]MBD8527962.1 GlsB/YeaQ/YmgE family stress response membrane protein [Pseudomarimonas arenosa]
MTLEGFITMALVGLLAGWLAGLVMRGRKRSVLSHLLIGVVGAFLGGWLLPMVGVRITGGFLGAVLEAFLGAVVLLALIGAIRR